ncbi:PilW family protein [Polaromonas eurypsychrophila]|nr:PilW family protein [Polaromonas eurypsychrophila]
MISRSRVRGVSLIEVMISMVIGIVVVGAVLISYIGSGQTNKRQAAYGEMNENAQIALSILRSDLLLAGYAQSTSVVNTGGVKTLGKTFSTKPILGCGLGFVSANTTGVAACKTTGTETPAIEISYEADLTNSIPTSSNFPSDCIGNSLQYVAQTVAVGGQNITFYETHNRYYLATTGTGVGARTELHCASAAKTSGGAAIGGQPLVDNVDVMQIWYGEAGAAGSRQIVRYVAAGPAVVIDWQNIISVRVCLLMRSSDRVLSGEDTALGLAGYLDCNSAAQTSADGYLRRAYFLTTTLRNKMTF